VCVRPPVHHLLLPQCSYNAETWGDGLFGPGSEAQAGAIPSCANHGLLNGLVRDQWGFDG